MIGNFGEAEVFSFHATKFFNTFEGGAVTTNDDQLAAKMRLMKNFGFAGSDKVISLLSKIDFDQGPDPWVNPDPSDRIPWEAAPKCRWKGFGCPSSYFGNVRSVTWRSWTAEFEGGPHPWLQTARHADSMTYGVGEPCPRPILDSSDLEYRQADVSQGATDSESLGRG